MNNRVAAWGSIGSEIIDLSVTAEQKIQGGQDGANALFLLLWQPVENPTGFVQISMNGSLLCSPFHGISEVDHIADLLQAIDHNDVVVLQQVVNCFRTGIHLELH